jgi:hypothetical protein
LKRGEHREEIILKSIFSTRDELIEIWKGLRAFNEENKVGQGVDLAPSGTLKKSKFAGEGAKV